MQDLETLEMTELGPSIPTRTCEPFPRRLGRLTGTPSFYELSDIRVSQMTVWSFSEWGNRLLVSYGCERSHCYYLAIIPSKSGESKKSSPAACTWYPLDAISRGISLNGVTWRNVGRAVGIEVGDTVNMVGSLPRGS